MGDSFYRSKDPANSIKATEEKPEKSKNTKYTYTYKIVHTKKIHI